MKETTLVESIAMELKSLYEERIPRIADHLKAMMPQYGLKQVRGDAQFAAWFERMALGYEVSPPQFDQMTGQMLKPAVRRGGPAWVMLLPYISGIPGHVESGNEILRRYERLRGLRNENAG